MNVLVEFLIENYIWFLVIALIIIFALIGYLVDMSKPKETNKNKIKPIAPVKEDNLKVHPSVEAYTNENFDDPLIDEKNT